MNVLLLAHTPNPEKIVAAAAKLCYAGSSTQTLLDNLDNPDTVASFLDTLMSLHHESPIEHISYTFLIEDVSRALLAQITRHRIASFSVQSQRYVNMTKAPFITPPSIQEDPDIEGDYEECLAHIQLAYKTLQKKLVRRKKQALMQDGMDSETAQKKAEKAVLEDARFILPNACATRMMVTMNARELLHFFQERCCNRAQWEIRNLAYEMLRLVYPTAPHIFQNAGPSCCQGSCREGRMSCGQAKKVYNDISRLKVTDSADS